MPVSIRSLFLSLTLCALLACSELPDHVVSPQFETGFSLPLLDTAVVLSQFIGNNGSLVANSSSGNYSFERSVDLPTLHPGDSLRVQSVAVNYSSSLNSTSMLINALSNFPDIKLGMEQLDATEHSARDVAVPSFDREIAVDLKMPEGIDAAICQSGSLIVKLKNELPVDLELGQCAGSSAVGVVLKTPGQVSKLCSIDASTRHIGARGRRSSSVQMSIPLNGTTLNSQTTLGLRFLSQGTNGKPVHINLSDGLALSFERDNIQLQSALGRLPNQGIDIEFDAQLPANTHISAGVIEEFASQLVIRNDFPMAGTARLEFPQMISQTTGKAFSYSFGLQAQSSQTISLGNNGTRYELKPDAKDGSHGNVISSLHGRCHIDNQVLTVSREFSANQVFSINGVVSPIRFSSVSGLASEMQNMHFSLSQNFNDPGVAGVQINSLSLREVRLQCQIDNKSKLQGFVSGVLRLYNDAGDLLLRQDMEQRAINASSVSTLNYVWNSLSLASLPTKLQIDADVKAADGSSLEIHEGNTISGTAKLSIPLSLSLKGGSYVYHSATDWTKQLPADKNRIQQLSLRIEALNKIPAGMNVSLKFYDEHSNLILSLPNSKSIRVDASSALQQKSFNELSLSKSDLDAVLASQRYDVIVSFDTPSDQYVQFTSADQLKLKMNLHCDALLP